MGIEIKNPMEANIDDSFKYTLSEKVEVVELNLDVEEELTEYKKIYDEMFISPLDMNIFIKQSKKDCFKSLYFLVQGKRCGGCTIFQDNNFGYIETIYVLPEVRGKGISKIILNHSFNYFLENRLSKLKLEVWELNKIAVNFYRSFDFEEVEKNLMFPGINLFK